MFDYILSADPWAAGKAKTLRDPDAIRSMHAEQHLAMVEEIVDRAKKRSINIGAQDRSTMEEYLSFWRGRIAASKTMVTSTGEIADRWGVKVVPTIVGAAHTEGMCEMLARAHRPFAVITPLSLQAHHTAGDLTWKMLDRKYERTSVYSKGFMETLLAAFVPPVHKKPQPVTDEGWFQAKAEMYLFTDRIVHAILGPPSPPSNGKPPFGLADDDFRGRRVSVDLSQIAVITTETRDGRRVPAVIFPVVLNPDGRERRKTLWVKACLGSTRVPGPERRDVEAMLKRALQDVQSKEEPPGDAAEGRVEDRGGRVQITTDVVATIMPTQGAAIKASI